MKKSLLLLIIVFVLHSFKFTYAQQNNLSQEKFKNISCEQAVEQIYANPKYKNLNSESKKDKRKITSYDFIMFDENIETWDNFKERLSNTRILLQNCQNHTEESDRLLSENIKLQELLDSISDENQIIPSVVECEYNELYDYAINLPKDEQSLHKLEDLLDYLRNRPLTWYYDVRIHISKTLDFLNEQIKNIKWTIKEEEINQAKLEAEIKNRKVIDDAVKKQHKHIKELDLPKDLLASDVFRFVTLQYEKVATLEEILSLISNNSKIKSISTRYDNTYLYIKIKESSMPSETFVFKIDDGELYLAGIVKNGSAIALNGAEKLFKEIKFFGYTNLY